MLPGKFGKMTEWFILSPGATTQQLLPQILRQVRLSDLQQLKIKYRTASEDISKLDSDQNKNSPANLHTRTLSTNAGCTAGSRFAIDVIAIVPDGCG